MQMKEELPCEWTVCERYLIPLWSQQKDWKEKTKRLPKRAQIKLFL